MERYVPHARHVEFQIFGDTHGNVTHLWERECSIQRRHQKIIEEAPAAALPPDVRAKMGEAAVLAAQAIGYTNAGTVEFMVDDDGNFYFLEVNTRLQVEHPVTEMIVGYDLVHAQLLVAAGEPMPFADGPPPPTGHAFECRVYAEDPAREFLPSTGTIEVYEPARGPGVRVDSGVAAGSVVSVHYDPMLAKLITWGRTRESARRRMVWALDRTAILGVTTNVRFMRDVLEHPAFVAGELHTRFLEAHGLTGTPPPPPDATALIAAGIAAQRGRRSPARAGATTVATSDPWRTAGAWRGA
jgi:acetyl/propionyl-CoA carboxylase alpha subunit